MFRQVRVYRCSINDNVEVLKKEVRKFQRLQLSSRSSTSSSNSNNDFTDQPLIPFLLVVLVKDLRILSKSQKIEEKLNSKIWELLNIISSLEKKMILLNETLQEETNNRLEKGEKIKNLFSGSKYIAKRLGKAFIRPE